jgi:predicted patatin/cPLA2 family phospholipase
MPIRALLKNRVRSQSKRGARQDGAHLALIVECGGMRGVAAGGFMQVFFDAGLVGAFDTIHGASAGACAAAYFLSGQPKAGRAIYHEDICHLRVVNPRRFWSRPAMVDTDFIVDEVIAKKRAIAADRILAEPDVLKIVTSRVSDGVACVHERFTGVDELLNALRASLRVPGPREPGTIIDSVHHLDGGIVAPIPVFSALRSGATHVVIVGTQRPQDYALRGNASRLEGFMLGLLYGRPLADAYEVAQGDRRGLAIAASRPFQHVDFLSRGDDGTDCSWSTIDRSLLLATEREAVSAARQYLNGGATAGIAGGE